MENTDVDLLGISEMKCTVMGDLRQMNIKSIIMDRRP